MGMVVRTNVMAMNANRSLGTNNTQVGKSLEKLSSGFRINRAADDASGLAISEKMKAQIKGLEQASANSQDGISLIQTAEGATQEIHNMLNRMVELATKSANGTIQNTVDRDAIQREVDDLNSEITRIASSTNFNGIKLLDGSMKASVSFNAATPDTNKTVSITGGTSTKMQAIDFTSGAAVTGTGLNGESLSVEVGGKTFTVNFKSTDDGDANTIVVNDSDTGTALLGKINTKLNTLAGDAATTDAAGTANHNAISTIALTASGTNTGIDAGTATITAKTAVTSGGLKLQVGDTNESFNNVTVSVADLSAKGLGIDTLKVNTQDTAGAAIATIKTAINTVSTNRANLGSLQNRLEYTISNLDTTTENMTSANSRIRDTDMAKEMMNYTKMNILTQAAQAMLAQANQQPQAILQLLQ